MERLTGKQVKSLAEAYAQVYFNPEEQVEVLQEESDQILEYTRFVDRPGQPVAKPNNQKRQEAERLAAAQRSARETVDRRQGRASINPQTGLRYTVQPGNVRRSEGQEATLGGKSVQWSVDKTGKGSWVPRETEGEMARRLNRTKQTPPARPATPAATPVRPTAPAAATTPVRPAPPARPAAPAATPVRPTAPAAATTPASSAPAPKTPNPLLKDNSISDMIKASQMRQRGVNVTSDNIASVRQSVQQANRPEVLNRPAPAGSALARQQQAQGSTVSGSGALGSAANPQVRAQLGMKPINPAPKPVPEKKQIQSSVDLFDIVKGHLMSEGASEQEALRLMVIMPEEEKMSIVEQYGSIGANMAGAELQRRLELRVREQERKKIEQEKRERSGASSQVKDA